MAESFGMDRQAASRAISGMLHGAVDTLFAGELPAERVMNLVPVRPMAADEDAIREMMRNRLSAIHAKLHPATKT